LPEVGQHRGEGAAAQDAEQAAPRPIACGTSQQVIKSLLVHGTPP
jgi:hypothetical protein